MIDWLTNNWKLFVIIAAILIDLILVLVFKKRPQVVDNSFITHLCSWILEAEKKYRNGADKKKYVLECASQYLGEKFSEKEVSLMIEYLLTVPEKKEKTK